MAGARREGAIHYLFGSDRYLRVQQEAGAAVSATIVGGVLVGILLAGDGEVEQPGAVVAVSVATFAFACSTVVAITAI